MQKYKNNFNNHISDIGATLRANIFVLSLKQQRQFCRKFRVVHYAGYAGAEMAVVTLPTIGDYAPSDVGVAIIRRWGIGAKAQVGDVRRNAGLVAPNGKNPAPTLRFCCTAPRRDIFRAVAGSMTVPVHSPSRSENLSERPLVLRLVTRLLGPSFT